MPEPKSYGKTRPMLKFVHFPKGASQRVGSIEEAHEVVRLVYPKAVREFGVGTSCWFDTLEDPAGSYIVAEAIVANYGTEWYLKIRRAK